jgi:hypothetical protein
VRLGDPAPVSVSVWLESGAARPSRQLIWSIWVCLVVLRGTRPWLSRMDPIFLLSQMNGRASVGGFPHNHTAPPR